ETRYAAKRSAQYRWCRTCLMRPSSKQCGKLCLLLLAISATWMSLATATAIHFLFEPLPAGSFKMDEMTEIGVMSTALNVSFPLGIIATVCGSILCVRRVVSLLPLALLLITFLSVGVCTFEVWSFIAGRYGPNVNLWKNHIWWRVGS
ncbi:MAG: hypothetical protein ABIV39_16535, partial [Verrucomicrobiota bacterium]